jgi:peroxiredoxin
VAEQAPGIAAEVIAQVNGRIVGRETLQVMLAADRAMADLLGQPLPSGDEVLDRLVNEELVWQAAQAAGVDLEEDRVAQALQDFLTARGRSMADLEQALAAHHLDLEGFTAYFGRLLLVDQFSRTQAQSQGLTVAEYLIQLQRDARISFGPAAEEALAQVQSSFSQPTPEAPAATPVPDMARGTDTGQYAPLFELPALNTPAADRLALDDLIGKPTLLSFWATGCPYCRRQTPVLVDAYGRYAEQGVQFVGINVGEDQEQVQSYITANGLPYPIALDVDGEVASRYGVRGIPVTYVLDAEGRVVARHLGQLSPEQVDSYLERLLMATRP